MVTNDWQKVVEEKIADAKSRGSKKRGWVKFTKSWLTSSINYRMELSEQAVFSKFIVMADEYGPVPGLISDNDFRAMPHKYLAHLACCPIEVFEATLKKSLDDDSAFENGHGIFLTHFDEYQFTEYDRQKPWREKRRAEMAGKETYKICRACGYKAKTSESDCPECAKKGVDSGLETDYKGGKYGHMVNQ